MNTKDELKEIKGQLSVLHDRMFKLQNEVDIERLNSVVGKYFRIWIDDGTDYTYYFTVGSVDEFGIAYGQYFKVQSNDGSVAFSSPGKIVGIGGFVTEYSLKSSTEITKDKYIGMRQRLVDAL